MFSRTAKRSLPLMHRFFSTSKLTGLNGKQLFIEKFGEENVRDITEFVIKEGTPIIGLYKHPYNPNNPGVFFRKYTHENMGKLLDEIDHHEEKTGEDLSPTSAAKITKDSDAFKGVVKHEVTGESEVYLIDPDHGCGLRYKP